MSILTVDVEDIRDDQEDIKPIIPDSAPASPLREISSDEQQEEIRSNTKRAKPKSGRRLGARGSGERGSREKKSRQNQALSNSTPSMPAAATDHRFPAFTPEGDKCCTNCGEVDTPQWRGTLCNACALWKRSRGTNRPLPLLFPVRRRRSSTISEHGDNTGAAETGWEARDADGVGSEVDGAGVDVDHAGVEVVHGDELSHPAVIPYIPSYHHHRNNPVGGYGYRHQHARPLSSPNEGRDGSSHPGRFMGSRTSSSPLLLVSDAETDFERDMTCHPSDHGNMVRVLTKRKYEVSPSPSSHSSSSPVRSQQSAKQQHSQRRQPRQQQTCPSSRSASVSLSSPQSALSSPTTSIPPTLLLLRRYHSDPGPDLGLPTTESVNPEEPEESEELKPGCESIYLTSREDFLRGATSLWEVMDSTVRLLSSLDRVNPQESDQEVRSEGDDIR